MLLDELNEMNITDEVIKEKEDAGHEEENVIQQLEELQTFLTKDQTSFQENFVQTKDLISQMALTLAFGSNSAFDGLAPTAPCAWAWPSPSPS